MSYGSVLLLFASFGLGGCYYTDDRSYHFDNNKYCQDLSPYFGEINLDQITGVWYGVEKIPHSNKDEYHRIERSRDCFYIDIKELYVEPTPPPTYGYGDRSLSYDYNNYNNPSYTMTTGGYGYGLRPFGVPEPYRMRHFVLEWHEGIWQDDYHVKVNTSHKGFWPTDVPKKSVEDMYRFFGGVIQVLRVANNYLVLNFCMRLPHSQFFSVVLSRNEHQLTHEDLGYIHNMFTAKHLSTSSLKRVCDNGAFKTTLSKSTLASILLVIYWRSRV